MAFYEREEIGPFDPRTVKSRFESEIGSRYIELVTACLSWADESKMQVLSVEDLPGAVKLPSFQKICKIHEDLQKEYKPKCVPEFFLELVDSGYGFAFIIPYVYIMKSVPPDYRKICLIMLGNAEDLPAIFKSLNIFSSDHDDQRPKEASCAQLAIRQA